MIEDGTSPYTIDEAMREFGYPMGIFEMQDLAGLDISWAMRKRQAETRNPADRYVDIPDRLCEMQRFGRKSGKGWYLYDNNKAQPDPDVLSLIESERQRKSIVPHSLSAEKIMQRILTVQHRTGDALLAEGIANSASDIDVVMINGYGFPRHKGGPMYWKSVQ
jgi:3-hydroxyacyl-CoA dehydrogenase